MVTSQEKLKELKSLLEQETETYQQMAQTMLDKKELLIKGQYKNLVPIDQKLVALGQKTAQIEANRLNTMQAMGHQDQTLGQLIEHLEPKEAHAFTMLRKKLISVVHDVQSLNKNNSKLIQLSIRWIEDTVETIAKAVTPRPATYNGKGEQTNKGQVNGLPVQSTVVRDI